MHGFVSERRGEKNEWLENCSCLNGIRVWYLGNFGGSRIFFALRLHSHRLLEICIIYDFSWRDFSSVFCIHNLFFFFTFWREQHSFVGSQFESERERERETGQSIGIDSSFICHHLFVLFFSLSLHILYVSREFTLSVLCANAECEWVRTRQRIKYRWMIEISAQKEDLIRWFMTHTNDEHREPFSKFWMFPFQLLRLYLLLMLCWCCYCFFFVVACSLSVSLFVCCFSFFALLLFGECVSYRFFSVRFMCILARINTILPEWKQVIVFPSIIPMFMLCLHRPKFIVT